ncbi:putative cyclase [Marasmius fiardii PR-910]|nr:putative cyclase [Marasmius fiardii PR-910]
MSPPHNMLQSQPVDISHTLESEISIYPGDPSFTCVPFSTVEKDGWSVHSISIGSHTGTHLDAPSHLIRSGKTVDEIPLSMLIGRARIINVTGKSPSSKITWEDIQGHFPHGSSPWPIVVLYTGWAKYWGTNDYLSYPFLAKQAAEELIKRGVSVLGVDTLSPDAIDGPDGYGVHEVFLGADKVLVENLNLTGLHPEIEEVMVSFIPLKLAKCDGSPIRAIAWNGINVAGGRDEQ